MKIGKIPKSLRKKQKKTIKPMFSGEPGRGGGGPDSFLKDSLRKPILKGVPSFGGVS